MHAQIKNTIYINNLNEKVKIDELKKSLNAVFSQFGEIVDIIAKKNLKMRGQAFIAFKEKEQAAKAEQGMKGFPLYDKPLRIEFAKCDSDCIAKILGTYIKREKGITNNRVCKKKVQQPPRETLQRPSLQNLQQHSHETLQQPSHQNLQQLSLQNLPPIAVSSAPYTYAESPRNNILFLRNLPCDTTEMLLNVLFRKFLGFKEIRIVPGRPEIAFAEFDSIECAEVAKNALQGVHLAPNQPINISFAKK